MDIQLMDIGVKLRDILMYTSRCGYRSVCNHPFLVGLLCFMMCLYRSFPFIFSLLVSASPVLVCTAVLLGILLSFGEPNVPEIENDEGTTTYESEAVFTKTGESQETVVKENEVKQSEDHDRVELLAGKLAGFVSEDTVPLIGEGERSREVELNVEEGWEFEKDLGDLGNDEKVEVIAERSQEVELNNGECLESKRGLGDDLASNEKPEWDIERHSDGERSKEVEEFNEGEHWELKRGLGDLGNSEKPEWDEEGHNEGEVVENHYAPIPVVDDGMSSSDDEKSEADSFSSQKVNVDALDFPPQSPWIRAVNAEEVEGSEDADSGSDHAESSSPDASLADIIPMLDELHPLLDQEASRTGHLSLDESDTASELPEPENEGENDNLDVVDGVNEDEEVGHGDKEEGRNSAFIWTEEDKKNVMDLGSSEIERNIRLESLILRRRARKKMNMLPMRDLIDLESLDFSFSVPPISTRWHNPFDNPQDSQDNLGLPPIPGSAPSVLLPRPNPFGIPYGSCDEKLNLSGGGFQADFAASKSIEHFCSHQSFNATPSLFAQDGDAVKINSYFVPKQTFSEGSSNSSLKGQSGENSELNAISVLETETISSVEDMRGRKFSEDDNLGKAEADEPTEECTEESVHQECGSVSIDESANKHVRDGSESLTEGSTESGQTEKAEFEDDEEELKVQLHYAADSYQQEGPTQYVELEATECHPNSGRSSSSLSSLSEESERVFTEMESGGMPILDVAEETGFTVQASVESNELNTTSALASNLLYREPVYDYSPQFELETQTHVSSSIATGVLRESDPGFPPVLVNIAESPIDEESELTSDDWEIETNILGSVEVLPESSLVADSLDESRPEDNADLIDGSNVNAEFSGGEQAFDDEASDTISLPSESSNEASTEKSITVEHNLREVSTSTPSNDILHSFVDYSEYKELDQRMAYPQCQQPTEANYTIENVEPPPEDQPNRMDSVGTQESVESAVLIDANANCESEENLISSPDEGNTSTILSDSIQEEFAEHPNQVQASAAPIKLLMEDDQTVSESNVPELQELDFSVLSHGAIKLLEEDDQTVSQSSIPQVQELDCSVLSHDAIKLEDDDQTVSKSNIPQVQELDCSVLSYDAIKFLEEDDQTVSKSNVPEVQELDCSVLSHDAVKLLEEDDQTVSESSIPQVQELDCSVLSHDAIKLLEEEDLTVSEANIAEQQELDSSVLSHDESVLSPDFTSLQSSAFEVARSHIDLQTIVEEVDEIKEIDELLSELENVGDFSTNQWVSGLNMSKKYEESIGGSKTEDTLHSEIPSIEEHVNLSKLNFSKSSDSEDSFDEEASKAAQMPKANEVCVEIQSMEDAEPVTKEINLTSVETKIMLEDADVSHQLEDNTRMPELEVRTIEEMDLAFKKISGDGIEKTVLQPSGDSPAVEMGLVEDASDYEKPIDGIGSSSGEKTGNASVLSEFECHV